MASLSIAAFFTLLGLWVFAHLHFYRALRNHAPEIYKANSAFGIGYISGFQWVEVALNGEYKKSSHTKVHSAAKLLRATYWWHGNLLGSVIIISCFALLLYALKVAINGNT